ncbi:phage virion morphogenesis protein [Sphingomonas sp. NFR15]|uniref:phage virion morphogenesis protein n=1 Tax=Sphingomonas sp. NFR15 TaxID=1566282 RepID=UPI000892626F|nr:phage virion morphogenesis protein [Sphingomonas sp. NFR15]SDA21565.1 phage virion morphogenesis (putative tail completion) protein [Sphingomonas sp. NFR15]
MDDLTHIESLAGALIRSLASGERRKLLRQIARGIRASQSARIARQQAPDGEAFAARRPKKDPRPGNHTAKFLYPKGAAEPRLVLMKSWVHDGPLLTGFDIEVGGIRSFFWDKIDRWVPVTPEEQNKGAGKFRRQGRIRQKAMFRKLRNGRNLRADATDREAWIGFTGRAAEIARVHQDGLSDRPAAKAKPVRYARRVLLGLTVAERSTVLDQLLIQLSSSLARKNE